MSRSSRSLGMLAGVAGPSFTKADTPPFVGVNGVGISANNQDTTTDLIFTVNYVGNQGEVSKQYVVPSGGTLDILLKRFNAINIDQSTTNFNMIVMEPYE